jgi:hypothetical protein
METKEEVKEEKGFKLPNHKVTIRLVDRPRGGLIKDKNHVMYNQLPGATFELCPRHKKGENVIDCPLSKEEIDWFESPQSGMAFSVGDLSPHLPKAENYWYSKRARVKLDDKEKTLNLSQPADYLKYKILLSNSDIVAPTLDQEFNKGTYIYVITSEKEVQKKAVTRGDKKKRAWKIAAKMEDDKQGMVDFLSVYGKRPSENSKLEFLQAEIDKVVEGDIDQFLDILEDDKYETRILLTKSLQNGSVSRDGHKYFLAGGDPLCAKGEINNMQNALEYLDALENQDIRLTLEAKINKA